MREKHIRYFMRIAVETSQLSYCNRLKVGAIIVKDDRVISIGYNGTLPGRPNVCECDGVTLGEVIHAEENAIMKVAKSNESTVGAVMFVTHQPCLSCSKMIANTGIKSVFFEQPYRCNDGVELLTMMGVNVKQVSV